MKKISFIAMLTIIYPELVMGYDYTLSDTNIRNHSYSVEQISADTYNSLNTQTKAPIFQTFENGNPTYYKWIAPDLMQYKTGTEADVFTTIKQDGDFVEIPTINDNNTYTTKIWYYNKLTATDNAIKNQDGNHIESVDGDFINTSHAVWNVANTNGGPDDIISHITYITSVSGSFIGNTVKTGGGAAILNTADYYCVDRAKIDTIAGNFIGNIAGIGTQNWYDPDYNKGFFGDGGAIHNYGAIGLISGNFIGNKTNASDGIESGGGAIYNVGNIDAINGVFIGNSANTDGYFAHGGAICNYDNGMNIPTIKNIDADFIGNYAVEGGAIYNSGDIDSIRGDFIGNSTSLGGSGAAIYNDGTIGSVSGNFLGNRNNATILNSYGSKMTLVDDVLFSFNSGGAINNWGQLNINIDGDSSVRFATYYDSIYNYSRITVTGTDETPGHIYLQDISGDGEFLLWNTVAELAPNRGITQKNLLIDEKSTLIVNSGGFYISDFFTNNGTLHFNGGTIDVANLDGNGNIVIGGDVTTYKPLQQQVEINEGASLEISMDNLRKSNVVNNGTIWIYHGALDANLSELVNTYGKIGLAGSVTANADWIDTDILNKGALTLNQGTLNHGIAGTGYLFIDNDMYINAPIVQKSITVNQDKILTTSADNLQVEQIANSGTLKLTGGQLSVELPMFGDYIDKYGDISWQYTDGDVIIDGDVTLNAKVDQAITINDGKSLTTSADDIANITVTNNGMLNLTSGQIISSFEGDGTIVISGDVSSTWFSNNNQKINIAESGMLTSGGFEAGKTFNIDNQGILKISGGFLHGDVNITGGKIIIDQDSSIHNISNIGDIEMNGEWYLDDTTVTASDVTLNGSINININDITQGSDIYAGGKLIADSITLGQNSQLRLVIPGGGFKKGESTGYLKLIESDSWSGDWNKVFANNLMFDIDYNDDLHAVKLTYTNSVSDIAQGMGAPQNIYVVVVVWDGVQSDNPFIQEIIDKLNYAAQYDNAGLISLLSNIAPTDSNVVSGTSRAVNNTINHQVSDRLHHVGRNGGDSFNGISLWTQGLYNHTSQSGDTEFSGNTFGFSLGADKKLNDNMIFGLGYALSKTKATSGDRNIDALGHTVFAYGEYRPYKTVRDDKGEITSRTTSQMYVNATLSYGLTNYDEQAEYGIASEYDTSTIGLNTNVGYDVTDNIDLYIGARYLKVSQDDYVDNIGQQISVQDDDIITARFGGKYTANGTLFAPTAHLELSYDVKSSDRLAIVNMNGSGYQISGDAINPFGVQTGVGFISNINNWDLSLNYDLEWRPDFISHTGRIKAKYVF